MAKDIKLYKDENEVIINETQLENFIALGYKQEQENKPKINNKDKKWQHITEKKES
jgi:hypothetical protein